MPKINVVECYCIYHSFWKLQPPLFFNFNPMHFSYFQYHQWQRNLFKNFLLFLQEDELHDLTFISKHMT